MRERRGELDMSFCCNTRSVRVANGHNRRWVRAIFVYRVNARLERYLPAEKKKLVLERWQNRRASG